MMSRMLGAPLGGTTVGGHHGLESTALSLITPPNFIGGGGSCLPSIVVVALGEPGVPVVCICALAEGAIAITAAANIPQRKICLADFIVVTDFLLFIEGYDFAAFPLICLWDLRAMPCQAWSYNSARLGTARLGSLDGPMPSAVSAVLKAKLRAVSRSQLHSSLNSYHLISFFPPTAVADILGEGDKVVELVA